MRHHHSAARVIALAAPLALLALAVASLLPGCAKKPDAPVWGNPFDPANGDPFHLTATVVNDWVILTWTAPANPGLSTVEVLRSTDDFATSSIAGTVAAAVPTFTDTTFVPNRMNWYKVRGRNATGQVSDLTNVASASAFTPPYARIARGSSLTATRLDTVSLLTSGGDAFELAATGDFSDATVLPAGADTVRLVRDFGPAAGNGEFKHLWVRVRTGSFFSLVVHDSIKTRFSPDLQVKARPATLSRRRLTLAIVGTGVTRMRFALSSAELPAATWVTPDSVRANETFYTGDLLGPSTAAQTLYAEFQCDFGYSFEDNLACTPDNLTGAHFALGTGDITGTPTVRLVSLAVATQMRFSETLDGLAAASWQAYADTSQFTLSLPVSGQGTLRRVYGQFANDWFSVVASDTIRFVPPPPGRRPAR